MCNPAIDKIRADLGKHWSVSTDRCRHLLGRSSLVERERLLWLLSLSHGRLGLNMQVSVPKRWWWRSASMPLATARCWVGIAVGDSKAEGFWHQFLGSLKERGLDGTLLVISDAHLGLTTSIRSRAG
jgi:hypothetical protein